MPRPFELLLFAHTSSIAAAAESAGVDGLVVDWENRGKDHRQAGFDTEINAHTREHLRIVRAATTLPIVCRLNGYGAWTTEEIEAALDDGADELLLPMVRRADEPARALDAVRGRAGLGILIETEDAICCRVALSRLPLSRVYVGLNDLAIDRGRTNIFEALVDGTVEAVRRDIDVPFGFGGLTVPHLGRPVPCHLLIHEMARLHCSFSFL
jgi:citrate lyase beta subunit